MTSSLTQPDDIPPFPPPSTFSILPDIYLLLSRLDILIHPDANGEDTTTNAPNGTDPSTTTTTLEPNTSGTAEAPLDPVEGSDDVEMHTAPSPSHSQTLRLKDLQYNLHPIRQKIQAAKEAVLALPDLERGVEEQRSEIERLEARVRGLRGRVGMLGALAGVESKTGVEGESWRGRAGGMSQNGGYGGDGVMEGVETGG